MNISVKTILKVLLVTAAFFGMLILAYMAKRELVWIGIAFFLAIVLNPAVAYFSRFMPRRSRGLSILTVLLLFVALVAVLVISFAPPIAQQTQSFVDRLPRLTDELIHGNSLISEQIRNFQLVDRIKESQDQIVKAFTSAGGQFYSVAQSVFSSLLGGLAIFGLTFFMLLEGERWVEAFWRVIPSRRRKHYQKLAAEMYQAVSGYVNGNLLTSLIAAVSTSILLLILDVPYAIPLGIVVGLFDIIPLIGATIGAIIVVTVAFFTSLPAAIIMLVFFLIYQQIENHVLQPIVYGKTVQMSPLLVLIAALLGAAVGGIVGALVAIPLFAALQILVRDFVSRHAQN